MNAKNKAAIEKFEETIEMAELRARLNATKKYRPTDYEYKRIIHLAKKRGLK